MGLKGMDVGVDIEQYAYRYANSASAMKQGLLNPEFGYNAIQYFFHDILGLSFQAYTMFVYAFILLALYHTFCKYVDDELVGLSLFMVCLFPMFMSGIRQSIAICVIMYAYSLADKRKWLLYFLTILVAFTIHNSSIICVPLYFLYRIRINRIQAIVIYLLALCSFFYRRMLNPVISLLAPAKYDSIELTGSSGLNLLVIMVPLFVILFSLLFLRVKKIDGKYSERNSFFFILSCIYIVLCICGLSNNQLFRLSYYFAIGLIVICSSSVYGIRFQGKVGLMLKWAIVILCWLYFFVSTPGGTLRIDNYNFFWQ